MNSTNKKLSIWLRILTLLMLLTICFTACGKPDEPAETEASETTGVVIETTSAPAEETTKDNKPSKHDIMEQECEYRVLISSDQHYTYKETWYSVTPEDRLQMWVDAVLSEHERRPFDLIILNGDYSLDFWGSGGSYTDDGVCTTKQFVDKYVSQIRAAMPDVPLYILPGNHDAFKDDRWVEMTGNHRQETFKLGNNVFVMMDSYANNLEVTTNQGGAYFLSPMDTQYLKDQVEAYPDCNIYLVSHHFGWNSAENASFRQVVAENDNIVALFQGHEHKIDIVNLGLTYHNAKIFNTGNFSYTGDEDRLTTTFWGFRDLLILEENAYSRYIVADSRAQVKGKWKDFTRSIKEPGDIKYPADN